MLNKYRLESWGSLHNKVSLPHNIFHYTRITTNKAAIISGVLWYTTNTTSAAPGHNLTIHQHTLFPTTMETQQKKTQFQNTLAVTLYILREFAKWRL